MAATANTIRINADGRNFEYYANTADVSPGMALTVVYDGSDTRLETKPFFQTDNAVIRKCIALENALVGEDVTTVYAIGSVVSVLQPLPGDQVALLIKDGQTIAVGDYVKPNGTADDGTFVEVAADTDEAWAQAIEAKSPSGSNDLCICVVI